MTDDTQDNDPQAREDALVAALEAGLFPGVSCAFADVAESSLVLRISRSLVLEMMDGGAKVGQTLADLPSNVHGRVALLFDGWASDPRELSQIPEVVLFCCGMLYGADPASNPDPAHPEMAKKVLPVLFDEYALSKTWGADAWKITGQAWVVGTAHASLVIHQVDGTQWRDIGLTLALRDVFLNRDETTP